MSKTKKSLNQAVHEVMWFVDQFAIAGRKEPTAHVIERALVTLTLGPSISLSWERGWAASARVTIRLLQSGGLDVEVGWSSTTTGAVGARVAAVLHGEVADLALALEHNFAELCVDFSALDESRST